MPEGVDPDEYLMQHGADGFDKLVNEGARDVLSYKWEQMHRLFRASADDLTGQQKAVEAYLELLSNARESGPVDNMRWGAALTRVSRLTGIPIDDLHARFRKRKVSAPRPAVPEVPGSPAASVDEAGAAGAVRIPLARALAERQMLGILLREPQRWHKIGQSLHPEDFVEPGHRRLADVYWQHQQDVGEPVFSEFLGVLEDGAVKDLAIGLMELAEQLEQVEETVNGALLFFEEERHRQGAQKQLAEIRRISQQTAGPASSDVEAKWAEFVKNNQSLDLRRLGPVRRFKSGS
jgi:DNA primase